MDARGVMGVPTCPPRWLWGIPAGTRQGGWREPGCYLHHSDLVGHQPVAHHDVALGDVQALLGHAGGEEQVEVSFAELPDHVLLLVLRGQRGKCSGAAPGAGTV